MEEKKSKNKRAIMKVLFCVLVIMLLFPPWIMDTPRTRGTGTGLSQGYYFLFDPPYLAKTIDFGRLFVQILLIATIAAGVALFKRNEDWAGLFEPKSLSPPDNPAPPDKPWTSSTK